MKNNSDLFIFYSGKLLCSAINYINNYNIINQVFFQFLFYFSIYLHSTPVVGEYRYFSPGREKTFCMLDHFGAEYLRHAGH